MHLFQSTRLWFASLFLCVLSTAMAQANGPPAAYTFTTVDVPFAGATATAVTGRTETGVLVGGYTDAGGRGQGFRAQKGRVSTLLNVSPQSINQTETIVGFFRDEGGVQGFLFEDGTFTAIRVPPIIPPGPPPSNLTEALGQNDVRIIVGDYRSTLDGLLHGFRFDPVTETVTTIDVPEATATSLIGINTPGDIVGAFRAGGRTHGLLVVGDELFEMLVPDVDEPTLVGITDDGTIAGNDATSGFVLKEGLVTHIEVPDAMITELFGISNDDTVYGRFIAADGVGHGFVATPTSARGKPHRQVRAQHSGDSTLACDRQSKRMACRVQD